MKPTIQPPVLPAVAQQQPKKQADAPLLPHESDEFVGEVASAADPRLVQAKKS